MGRRLVPSDRKKWICAAGDARCRRGERGLGRAYTAGIIHALDSGFQIIGTMDADLTTTLRICRTCLP